MVTRRARPAALAATPYVEKTNSHFACGALSPDRAFWLNKLA